ncbi:MAG: transporter substrate-binding domain-containing protein [Rhodospirillales bacterium]|nr:transporter substrate-binding domain-containing protein [Rhodospirillales bacterium]
MSWLFLSVPAVAEKLTTSPNLTSYRFVYADTYPPLSHGNGPDVQGLLPDIVNQVVERVMGIPVAHRGEVWPRAQRFVKTGKAFAFITSPNPDRLSYAYQSEQSVLTLPIRFFTFKGSAAEKAVKSGQQVEQLKEFRFCRANADGWSERYLNAREIRHVVPRTYESCLKMMERDRVDIIVHSEDVIVSLAKRLGIEGSLIAHPKIVPESPNFHLLVSKKDPNALTFLSQFDKAFKAYKLTKGYANLLKNYGYSYSMNTDR